MQFKQEKGAWQAVDDYNASFEEIRNGDTLVGYRFTTPSDTHEYFDTAGQLTRIEYLGGGALDFAYDANNRLASVTDDHGRSLVFGYDASNRIVSMTTPDGVFAYAYDGNNNLMSVTKPDTAARTYHYEDANHLNALTGITDEAGIRIATWAYDTQGRAISSEHAGGVDHYTVAYNADNSTTVTNPLGKQTTYRFQTILGVRKITSIAQQASPHSPAATETNTYTTDGRLATATDAEGNVTAYTYDARGLETTRVEAQGSPQARTITTTWDATYRLPDVITEPGRTTDYDYDADGRVTQKKVTDTATGEVRTTTYTYHPNTTDAHGNTVLGRLASENGPRTDVADITTYGYDAHLNLNQITDALEHTVQFTAFDDSGRPLSRTDENGVVTTYAYDAMGRLVTQTRGRRTTAFTYDNSGLLHQVSLPDGRSLTYSYDAAQRLVGIQNASGERTEYVLDNAGNRIEEVMLDASGTVTRRHRREFDELSRLLTSIDTINGTDARTGYTYDGNGNLRTVTDPYNHTSTNVYDALQRVSSIIDAKSGVTTSSYTPLDQLSGMVAPNNAHTTFSRNAFGDVVQEVSPDRGTTQYTYDSAGNLITKTDARGITATYTYDALNRLTAISYPDSSENVTYAYDTNPGGAITCDHGIGRVCRMTDPSGVTHFAYDAYGNVVQRVHTELGVSYTHQFAYDAADRPTQWVTSSGRVIQLQRDGEGRINTVSATVNSAQKTLVSKLAYQPDGQESQATFGNGLAESRSFDENGHLQSASQGSGTSEPSDADVPLPAWALVLLGSMLVGVSQRRLRRPMGGAMLFLLAAFEATLLVGTVPQAQAEETLGYDLKGNIVSRQNDSGTTTFQYDELNRLTHEQGPQATQGFTYDANGNRLSDGGGSYTYQTSSNVMVTQHGQTVTHDAAGNMTSDGQGLTFEYNQAGGLKRVYKNGVLQATYTYNALGQRTRKVTPTATTVYHYDLDGHLIEETLANGTPQVTYVWREDKPTAAIYAPGTPSNSGSQEKTVYLHTDHLDTPRKGTDDNKATVWQWNSDAFGSTAANESPDGAARPTTVNLRFPGQYYDKESGLNYNWHRYYKQVAGRYISSDSVGLIGGLNMYNYVTGNPLLKSDPTGLCDVQCQVAMRAAGLGRQWSGDPAPNKGVVFSLQDIEDASRGFCDKSGAYKLRQSAPFIEINPPRNMRAYTYGALFGSIMDAKPSNKGLVKGNLLPMLVGTGVQGIADFIHFQNAQFKLDATSKAIEDEANRYIKNSNFPGSSNDLVGQAFGAY